MRCALLLCALAGCGPAATEGGPAAAPPTVQVDVVVSSPPPADKPENKPPAPGFGYIWVAGHWDNVEGNYIWKEGRWMQGKADYEYVRARYEFDGARQVWVYHRPHWKKRRTAAQGPGPAPALTPPPAPVAPPADGGTM